MTAVDERRYIRADGLPKVTGQARYAADLAMPGMLHAAFLYAGVPSARIRRLDTSAARALPGVLAVITAADVPEVRYGAAVHDRSLFARDVVRFEGEILAAVAALTPELAQRGDSPDRGRARGAPGGPRPGGRPAARFAPRPRRLGGLRRERRGRPGRQRLRLRTDGPGRPRGRVRRGRRHRRGPLRRRHDPPGPDRATCRHRPVGGRQGDRLEHDPDAVPRPDRGDRDARAAREPGPDRRAPPRRRVRRQVRVPLRGAHRRPGPRRPPPGPARLRPAPGVRGHRHGPPRGRRQVPDGRQAGRHDHRPRGPSRPRHRRLRDARSGHHRDRDDDGGGSVPPPQPARRRADRVHQPDAGGLDPGAVRTAGLLGARAAHRQPGRTSWAWTRWPSAWPTWPRKAISVPAGQTFEKIGARESLEAAARLIDWGAPLPAGEGKGLALGWWFSAPGPSGAYIKLNADGSATIVTGAQENGSGSVMGLALLASRELGLPTDRISLVYQDTDSGAFDWGSSGSQTTFNVGRAVVRAAGNIRERLLRMAAERLEANPADLELVDGLVRAKDAPGRSVTIASLAQQAQDDGELITGEASPPAPAMPAGDAGGVRRPGLVPHLRRAGVLRPCRPRPGRPRDGRRPGAQGDRRARLRPGAQPVRRGGPGRGRHRPRSRHRPDRGDRLPRGPPGEPAPPRLQAPDRGRRARASRSRSSTRRPPTAARSAPRASASHRSCPPRERWPTRSRRRPGRGSTTCR